MSRLVILYKGTETSTLEQSGCLLPREFPLPVRLSSTSERRKVAFRFPESRLRQDDCVTPLSLGAMRGEREGRERGEEEEGEKGVIPPL